MEREVDVIATTTHDAFCTMVMNFFYKPMNKVRARHEFFTHQQTSGESVHDYVMELRVLARDCEFGMMEKELIATQLVVGCCNSDAKKTAFTESAGQLR